MVLWLEGVPFKIDCWAPSSDFWFSRNLYFQTFPRLYWFCWFWSMAWEPHCLGLTRLESRGLSPESLKIPAVCWPWCPSCSPFSGNCSLVLMSQWGLAVHCALCEDGQRACLLGYITTQPTNPLGLWSRYRTALYMFSQRRKQMQAFIFQFGILTEV